MSTQAQPFPWEAAAPLPVDRVAASESDKASRTLDIPGPEPRIIPKGPSTTAKSPSANPMPWEAEAPLPVDRSSQAPGQKSTFRSELERAGGIIAGSSGAKMFTDLGAGARVLSDLIVGNRVDPASLEHFKQGASGLAGMFRDEPVRMWNELTKSGEAMTRGDINEAANHLWFSIPFAGAAGATMAEYLNRGDVRGALYHAVGSLLPAVAEPGMQAAERTVAATPAAIRGTAKGAYGALVSPRTAGEAGAAWTASKVFGPKAGAAVGATLTGLRTARGAFRGAKAEVAARTARLEAEAAARAEAEAAARAYAADQAGNGPNPRTTQLAEDYFDIERRKPPDDGSGGGPGEPPDGPGGPPGGGPPPPGAPPGAPPPGAPSAAAADFTLDDFAKSLGKKPFAKLSAEDQQSVQAAYDLYQRSLTSGEGPIAPPSEVPQADISATAADVPAPTGGEPAPAAPVENPADIASQLKAAMLESGTITEGQAAPAPALQLAQKLYDYGYPIEAADQFAQNLPALQDAATQQGIAPPTEATLPAVIARFKELHGVEPAAEGSIAEQLKQQFPGSDVPPPKEGPHKPTASEARIEKAAQEMAADDSIPDAALAPEYVQHEDIAPAFEKYVRDLTGANPQPGEPAKIVARAKEIREAQTVEKKPPASETGADRAVRKK